MTRRPPPGWQQALLPTFRALTAERLAELRALRAAVRQGADPGAGLRRIGALAHQIAGTAATMGFARLGAVAAEVEERCGRIPRAGGGGAEALAAGLDALEAELARAAGERPAGPGAAEGERG